MSKSRPWWAFWRKDNTSASEEKQSVQKDTQREGSASLALLSTEDDLPLAAKASSAVRFDRDDGKSHQTLDVKADELYETIELDDTIAPSQKTSQTDPAIPAISSSALEQVRMSKQTPKKVKKSFGAWLRGLFGKSEEKERKHRKTQIIRLPKREKPSTPPPSKKEGGLSTRAQAAIQSSQKVAKAAKAFQAHKKEVEAQQEAAAQKEAEAQEEAVSPPEERSFVENGETEGETADVQELEGEEVLSQKVGEVQPKQKRRPPVQGPVSVPGGPDKVFSLLYFLFLLGFSLPIWCSSWLPMEDLGLHLGSLAAFASAKLNGGASAVLAFEPWFYAGSMPTYLLFVVSQFCSPERAMQLLMQGYIFVTPLSLLFLLRTVEKPRWNVFFGFFFLYNSAFRHCDVGFLLATPILLFGLACLYRWIVFRQSLGGLGMLFATGLLFLVNLQAYLLFLVLVFVLAYVLAGSVSEWFGNMMLIALSFLLAGPWIYSIVVTNPSIPGTVQGAPLFAYHDWLARLAQWPEMTGGWFTGVKRIGLVGMFVVLVLLGMIAGVKRNASTRPRFSQRAYLVVLFVLLLGLGLLWPHRFLGKVLPVVPFVSLAGFCLVGWIHLQTGRLDGILLIGLFALVGLGYAGLLTKQAIAYDSETSQIRRLMKQVPKGKSLLVWQMGHAKALHVSLEQSGGIRMGRLRGMSNLDLRRLTLSVVKKRKKRNWPHPSQTKRPPLIWWDYLLTTKPLTRRQQMYIRWIRTRGSFLVRAEIVNKKGPFLLYRIRNIRRRRRPNPGAPGVQGLRRPNPRQLAAEMKRTEALAKLVRLCRQGKARHCRSLGISLQAGVGLGPPSPKARNALERGCQLQDAMSCRLLALGVLRMSRTKEKEPAIWQAARYAYQRACQYGDAMGCFEHAKLARKGLGGGRNCKAALRSFRLACQRGLSRACRQRCR